MSLAIATEVITRLRPAASPDAIPSSDLLLFGQPTAHPVSGAVLEAAVRWNDLFVLFMTDDTPYEEQLGIHLVDSTGAPLDSATLGGAYTTGSFAGPTLREPDTIGFRFIGDTDWSVRLLPAPQLRPPFGGDAPGVRRAIGLRRHFIVCGRPRPAA